MNIKQKLEAERPQYVILAEAGWPSHHPVVPVSAVVGLKKRRSGERGKSSTFSISDPDMELINLMKTWCLANNVTFTSFVESAIFEKLEKVGDL